MTAQGQNYVRTRNSLRNSFVALSLQVAAILVGFFARRVFIQKLGVELMGLNSTAASILNMLNLAELGISTAVSVTLYKPLHEKDRQSVRELIALQGWMFRRIGFFVMAGSAVILCFFPQIFAKSGLPLSYSYATYLVLLYTSLLWYFFNYKKNLLYADQKNYKVLLSTQLVGIVKQVLQMVAILRLDHGYFWWLALEAATSTISTLLVRRTVDRTYPFLRQEVRVDRDLRRRYPEILSRTKFIAFHKLGGYAVSQLSPIFIYAFVSLTVVGMYSNYMLLTGNLAALLTALYAGVTASIGDMVAEGDKSLIMKVFRELLSSRILLVGTCCICLWFLTEPFIGLWLGPGYRLGGVTLALVIALFYISNTRTVVDDYLVAHGSFQDIWAPVAEAAINVGLSLLFGRRWGLDGVLAAVLVSQIAIVFLWKPIFLFRTSLHIPLTWYAALYLRCLLPLALGWGACHLLSLVLPVDPSASIWSFLFYAICIGVTGLAVSGLVMHFTENGIRTFWKRIWLTVRH
ncbi:MAG: sugar transporter [Bacteroidales bacterium]|nr:sugar transporter [Bacteroidales bacterium]